MLIPHYYLIHSPFSKSITCLRNVPSNTPHAYPGSIPEGHIASSCHIVFVFFLSLFTFGHAAQLMGSLFPDQD